MIPPCSAWPQSWALGQLYFLRSAMTSHGTGQDGEYFLFLRERETGCYCTILLGVRGQLFFRWGGHSKSRVAYEGALLPLG
jgi:hypothetical protein